MGIDHAVWGFGGYGQFKLLDFRGNAANRKLESEEQLGAIPRLIGGGTPMARNIQICTYELLQSKKKHGKDDEDLVAFTVCDGQPDSDEFRATVDAIRDAERKGVVIFGLIFCNPSSRMQLKPEFDELFGNNYVFIDDLDKVPDIIARRLRTIWLAGKGNINAARRLK